MHHYDDDEGFDWQSLNKAVLFFDANIKRWARLCVHTKEKYGTMRLEYLGMGHKGIYGLLNPGHLFFKWKSPTMYLINQLIEDISSKTGLSKLFWKYQRLVFNIITYIAVKRWPHIKDEMLFESEFNDLLYDWMKRKINYKNYWRSV